MELLLTQWIENTEDPKILNDFGTKYLENRQYSIAKRCFEKAASKENGNAIYNLGLMYYRGLGVEKNPIKAVEYIERAADKNIYNAIYDLGALYYNGEAGVEKDYQKAEFYFKKLPEDNKFNKANYFLGTIYLNNNDFGKAKQYFELAIKQGNINAPSVLGAIYERGIGVVKDLNKAKKYYELGVQRNDQAAIVNLGTYYQAVEGNVELAKHYFGISEHPMARRNLGLIYFQEGNYPKAKEYFELAAQYNDPNSIYLLGTMYLEGLGVEQNFETSVDYLIRAANLGYQDAIDALNRFQRMGEGVIFGEIKKTGRDDDNSKAC